MPSETEALGRRAMACAKWRWLPGMIAQGIYPGSDHTSWVRIKDFHNSKTCGAQAEQLQNPYPNLYNYETLVCLLHLVREAWDDDYAWLESTNRYYAFDDKGPTCCEQAWILHVLGRSAQTYRKIPGMTEAEALVAALEASPTT